MQFNYIRYYLGRIKRHLLKANRCLYVPSTCGAYDFIVGTPSFVMNRFETTFHNGVTRNYAPRINDSFLRSFPWLNLWNR